MSARLSFGFGPLRFNIPLSGKRRRKRRPSQRQPTYSGVIRFADGKERACEHKHRTGTAAAECGRRMARQAGLTVAGDGQIHD